MAEGIVLKEALKETARHLNLLTTDVLELLQIVRSIELLNKNPRLKILENRIMVTGRELAKMTTDVWEAGTEK